MGSNIAQVNGFIGNFQTEIAEDGASKTIEHGVAIIATGAKEYKPTEDCCGQHPGILTHLEFDALLKNGDPRLDEAEVVAFIQCVGSRDFERPYCSKVCCTHSVISALEVKKRNPDANVYVFYRDMRTYGVREEIYREARAKGVIFCRYERQERPKVIPKEGKIAIQAKELILSREIQIEADSLCLATTIVSNNDLNLAHQFKVPLDSDGWFLEAHQKLRSVDFATDGVFVCGMAHYPKPIDESIAQAKAAASRAISVLAMEKIQVGGVVSYIDPELCSGCLGCINVCPFGAITFDNSKKIAVVNQALCKGCGACAATCPSEAPVLMGFRNDQIYAQIKNVLSSL